MVSFCRFVMSLIRMVRTKLLGMVGHKSSLVMGIRLRIVGPMAPRDCPYNSMGCTWFRPFILDCLPPTTSLYNSRQLVRPNEWRCPPIDEYTIDGTRLVVRELALLTAYGDDSSNGILLIDHLQLYGQLIGLILQRKIRTAHRIVGPLNNLILLFWLQLILFSPLWFLCFLFKFNCLPIGLYHFWACKFRLSSKNLDLLSGPTRTHF